MANKRRSWTPDDLEFLRDNYQTMTNRQLAAELGRSERAVVVRLHILKWRRTRPKPGPAQHFKQPDPPGPGKKEQRQPDEKIPAATRAIIAPELLRGDHCATSDEDVPMLSSKDFLIIDFSMYGDLFNKVIEAAAENFRTPQLQVLFYCHQAINGQTAK